MCGDKGSFAKGLRIYGGLNGDTIDPDRTEQDTVQQGVSISVMDSTNSVLSTGGATRFRRQINIQFDIQRCWISFSLRTCDLLQLFEGEF